MKKIVLDTNFLMAIFELKIDIFEEIFRASDSQYKLFVLKSTLVELESFINGPLLSKRQAARLAKKILQEREVAILDPQSEQKLVDDQLVALEGYVVATVDADLKKRLKKKGVRLLTIRQKRYVVFE